jgi:hypothetical protein
LVVHSLHKGLAEIRLCAEDFMHEKLVRVRPEEALWVILGGRTQSLVCIHPGVRGEAPVREDLDSFGFAEDSERWVTPETERLEAVVSNSNGEFL